jgi:hypothetical protein
VCPVVQRLVQRRQHIVRTEPVPQLTSGGTVCVIKVMACGEDLNSLRSPGRKGVEEAGMEPLLQKNVCGNGPNHPNI